MRTLTAALLFLSTAALTGQQQPDPKGGKGKAKDDPKAKKDQDLFQGNWDIVGLEVGGKAEPEKNYKGNSFNFAKDKATLREGGFPPVEFTFTLDPTKTPKTIELAGKNNVPFLRGIYKLDGDNLTLSVGLGAARPAEFATKAGGDNEVFLLKRNRWERYFDKAGFSVDLPGRPEERRRDVDGKVTTSHVVPHEPERVTYMVSVTQLPAKPDAKQAAAALEAMRAAVLSEIDAKAKPTVESDREFKEGKGGYAGREVTVSLELPDSKGKETVRARVFVAGDRVYGLAVYGLDDAVKAANVLRFWGSFRPGNDGKKG